MAKNLIVQVMYESSLSSTVHIGEKQASEITTLVEKKIATYPEEIQKALRFSVWGSEHALNRHYNHEKG
jgi:hypothetical protein